MRNIFIFIPKYFFCCFSFFHLFLLLSLWTFHYNINNIFITKIIKKNENENNQNENKVALKRYVSLKKNKERTTHSEVSCDQLFDSFFKNVRTLCFCTIKEDDTELHTYTICTSWRNCWPKIQKKNNIKEEFCSKKSDKSSQQPQWCGCPTYVSIHRCTYLKNILWDLHRTEKTKTNWNIHKKRQDTSHTRLLASPLKTSV